MGLNTDPKVIDLTPYEELGWSKAEEGVPPKTGVPWKVDVEGKATVLGPEGLPVTGPIISLKHVAAVWMENLALGLRMIYAISPGTWPQGFIDQTAGGILTVLYTVIDGNLWFGIVPAPRFLHVTDGKADVLWDFPSRFLFPDEDPFEAILSQIRGIKGLEESAIIYPLPEYKGQKIQGTMNNRALTLVVNDAQSNKCAAMFIQPSQLKVDEDGYHRVLEVEYDPPMPANEDKSRAAESLRKDIAFLKSVKKARFMPWADLALLGLDDIVAAQAFRVLGAVRAGLLPTG